MTRWNGAAPTAAPFWNLCSFFHGSRRLPAFLSSGLSKKKTLKKTGNPVFLSQLKQTRRKRSVCRKSGGFAPFLPPAFMRGEGHEVAGGVPRRSGESLLSHGFAVPAPPEGKPRALRTVPAPRIYEGGGPRSGRGSPPAAAGKASSVTASPCQLPQRGSRGRFAPFLPPHKCGGQGWGFRRPFQSGDFYASDLGHRLGMTLHPAYMEVFL